MRQGSHEVCLVPRTVPKDCQDYNLAQRSLQHHTENTPASTAAQQLPIQPWTGATFVIDPCIQGQLIQNWDATLLVLPLKASPCLCLCEYAPGATPCGFQWWWSTLPESKLNLCRVSVSVSYQRWSSPTQCSPFEESPNTFAYFRGRQVGSHK